jgi:protein-disulfide isomerase
MARLKLAVSQYDHVRGNFNAPVTLVEYGDYECPSCGQAYTVVERLCQHFGGNLRFAFRHFPLSTVHPLAGPAAETAEFTALHDNFWTMHDSLFLNQGQLGMPLLFALAGALDLPQSALRDALTSGTCAGKIQTDFLGGVRSGVNGTPTFFVNRLRYDAPMDFAHLAGAIEGALAAPRMSGNS